ncbi:unnamed protein product [Phytophthora lilii]|uniref:Unnamed protein product n=1 Tax=Phytophthora lilii TaxID=2077276 RepID=A0A9W6WXB1_9STRA|nr:unnamed protein product [Phytophthora lilii]
MGRGLPLTDIERGRIQGIYEAGYSQRRIASQVQRSVGAVHRVLFIPQKLHKKPGPATLLSDRELRLLLRTAAKGQLFAKQLQLELKLSTSVRTIQRVLAGVDWLVYSKMENTLPLSTEDKRAREAWAWDMVLNKDPSGPGKPLSSRTRRNGISMGRTDSKATGATYPAHQGKRSGRWVGDGEGGF